MASDDNKGDDIHAKALARFSAAYEPCIDERELCLSDRMFYSVPGAMWDGIFGEVFENRPRIESNKILLSVIRVFNEYRNNRIDAVFLPKDGSDAGELADLCAGLYRADEQDSSAQEALDNAFDEGVGGGFGAWRLTAIEDDDLDDDNDNLRIAFEPIHDADMRVFFDPNSKKQDKSDARFAFLLTPMTPEAYREEYDDEPSGWESPVDTNSFEWFKPDIVYVAEYYEVQTVPESVFTYTDIMGNEEVIRETDLDDDRKAELKAIGSVVTSERKKDRRKVRKWILSGGGVLDDCGFIAGGNIPIIPFFGKHSVVGGIERCSGIVRPARDTSILKNMLLSALAEVAMQSTIQKPIFTPEQVAGHENSWADDLINRSPYQLINSIMDPSTGQKMPMGPVGMTQPPQVAPAMAALLQISEQDMSDILGNQQQGDELLANTSGKAIEMQQTRLDGQTFIYMDNMGKAVERCGKIWLGMARELYNEPGRRMKTVGSRDETDSVVLKQPMIDEDNHFDISNDMSRANFDVVVEVGPTSSSRRMATVNSLVPMLQFATDPADQKVLTASIMANMEGEGISEVNEYYRKELLSLGIGKPTKQDKEDAAKAAEAAQGQQPSPNDQLLIAAAQKDMADAAKTAAETDQVGVKTMQIAAQTEKTLAETAEINSQGIQQTDPVAQAVKLRRAGATPLLN